jgi:hypothetical protein
MTDVLRYVGFALVVLWALLAGAAIILKEIGMPFEGLGLFSFGALFVGAVILFIAAGIDRFTKRDDIYDWND